MSETKLLDISGANTARKEHSRIFDEYRDALNSAGPKLKTISFSFPPGLWPV